MAASHLGVAECSASLLLSSARHRIAQAIALEGDLSAADSAGDDPKSATAAADRCAYRGRAAANGWRLTECRHRFRRISLQLRISFPRAPVDYSAGTERC